jgi:hypothetical protein
MRAGDSGRTGEQAMKHGRKVKRTSSWRTDSGFRLIRAFDDTTNAHRLRRHVSKLMRTPSSRRFSARIRLRSRVREASARRAGHE